VSRAKLEEKKARRKAWRTPTVKVEEEMAMDKVKLMQAGS
jgi:hypothetical protein